MRHAEVDRATRPGKSSEDIAGVRQPNKDVAKLRRAYAILKSASAFFASIVIIGTDSHKCTQTVVVLDEVGRRLGTTTVPAERDGHLALVECSTQFADHDTTKGPIRGGGLQAPDPVLGV